MIVRPHDQEKVYPPTPVRARALSNASISEIDVPRLVENTERSGLSMQRERSTGSSPSPKVKDTSFDVNDLHVRWFRRWASHVSANCLDRHNDDEAPGSNRDSVGTRPIRNENRQNATIAKLARALVPFPRTPLKRLGVQKAIASRLYMSDDSADGTAIWPARESGAVHSFGSAASRPKPEGRASMDWRARRSDHGGRMRARAARKSL